MVGGSVPLRVFISYAHESDEHVERVRDLWIFLRRCGIDAKLDRVAVQRRQDWALWMGDQVREADHILVIASKAYRERAEGRSELEVGKGVQWEARLIRDAFYRGPRSLDRFVPVILPGQSEEGVPDFLAPATTTVFTVHEYTPDGAEHLLRFLLAQPKEVEPPLGTAPTFEQRDHGPGSSAVTLRAPLVGATAVDLNSQSDGVGSSTQVDQHASALVGARDDTTAEHHSHAPRDAGVTDAVNVVSARAVPDASAQAGVVHGGMRIHSAALRPSTPIPRQLPAAPYGFVGRVDHLAVLDRLVIAVDSPGSTGSAVVISAIGGTGGIGKTWLALAWAHLNLHLFSDGQLFVDLHGFGPTGQAASTADVLSRFLEALGVDPDRIPDDVDARADLYRSMVAGRRMLIVLDNAATSEQVVPLLPGSATCTVLVTSRNRLPALLTRHGARPIRLDVLTESESLTLMATVLGPERTDVEAEDVRKLILLCGKFPLALGLIAARAAAEPHVPLNEAVAELRDLGLAALDSDDSSASLPAVMSWSLQHLTDRQRALFALLGIAPGSDIGLHAASNLAGLSLRDTRTALHTLVDASLITRTSDSRFTMHDLVRAHATADAHTSLTESVRQAALERVVDFYIRTAHTADQLLYPHRLPIELTPPPEISTRYPLTDEKLALKWFDAEYPCLLSTQRTCIDQAWHKCVWQIAWTLSNYHYRRGRFHNELDVWKNGLAAAEKVDDPALLAVAHQLVGAAFDWLERPTEASGHLETALHLTVQAADVSGQALTHRILRSIRLKQGNYPSALDHAKQAVYLLGNLDIVGQAEALNGLGSCHLKLDEYAEAHACFEQALTIHRNRGNRGGEANVLENFGNLAHVQGRHAEAIRYHAEALAMYRNQRYEYEEANTLDRMAESHVALGQHKQAVTAWKEALDLYRDQGRTDAERVQRRLDNFQDGIPSP